MLKAFCEPFFKPSRKSWGEPKRKAMFWESFRENTTPTFFVTTPTQ
jgi:hypothetical protein